MGEGVPEWEVDRREGAEGCGVPDNSILSGQPCHTLEARRAPSMSSFLSYLEAPRSGPRRAPGGSVRNVGAG